MRRVAKELGDIEIDGVWWRLETAADVRYIRPLSFKKGVKLARSLVDVEKRLKDEKKGAQDGAKRGY